MSWKKAEELQWELRVKMGPGCASVSVYMSVCVCVYVCVCVPEVWERDLGADGSMCGHCGTVASLGGAGTLGPTADWGFIQQH